MSEVSLVPEEFQGEPAWLKDCDSRVQSLYKEGSLDNPVLSGEFLVGCTPLMAVKLKESTKVGPEVSRGNQPQSNYSADDYEETSDVQYLLSEKKLGVGGAGAVHEGWYPKMDKAVAIKVLNAPTSSMNEYEIAEQKSSFEREAKTIASLLHPAIPRVIDYRVVNGQEIFVMEKIDTDKQSPDGYQELGKVVGSQSREGVLRTFKDLCEVMDYCAERGVFHRDLTPTNMMVKKDGGLLVMDFGLSNWAKPATPDGGLSAYGTPSYMSPERVTDQPDADVGLASEIYGAGSVLYEMLTGKRFFPHMENGKLLNPYTIAAEVSWKQGLLTQEQKDLWAGALRVGLNPEMIQAIFLKSHDLDPQKRFQSGSEFLAAVAAAIIPSWQKGDTPSEFVLNSESQPLESDTPRLEPHPPSTQPSRNEVVEVTRSGTVLNRDAPGFEEPVYENLQKIKRSELSENKKEPQVDSRISPQDGPLKRLKQWWNRSSS